MANLYPVDLVNPCKVKLVDWTYIEVNVRDKISTAAPK
jgi:hypothetical protein